MVKNINNKEIITRFAHPIGPEDLRPKMYVAVSHVICRRPPIFAWIDNCGINRDAPPEIWIPDNTDPPTRVEQVALPFIFVTPPKGRARVIDTRNVRLVKIPKTFARAVFRSYSKS